MNKQIFKVSILAALASSTLFVSCHKDDDGNGNDSNKNQNKEIKIADRNLLEALLYNPDVNKNRDEVITLAEAEAVKTLNISEYYISDLSGLENFKNLEKLDCSDNLIKEINLSDFPKLKELDCSGNKISSLDLSISTLTKLDCSQNNISSLDLSKATNLTELECSQNDISSLDLSKASKLEKLDCEGNKIETLDISNMSNLQTISCGGQELGGSDMKLVMEENQYETWEKNLDNNKDANVDVVMNIFTNVSITTNIDGYKSIENGGTVIASKSIDHFTFGIHDNIKNDGLAFKDKSVLDAVKWETSDVSIAKPYPTQQNYSGTNHFYGTMEVYHTAGKTTISAVDGMGNRIYFYVVVE